MLKDYVIIGIGPDGRLNETRIVASAQDLEDGQREMLTSPYNQSVEIYQFDPSRADIDMAALKVGQLDPRGKDHFMPFELTAHSLEERALEDALDSLKIYRRYCSDPTKLEIVEKTIQVLEHLQ